MTATLVVTAPGLQTTVQDLGRFGYQAQGVPVAGALDPVALRLTNCLVGNPQATAALEFLYAGPTLEVVASSVLVAAAHAEIEILGPSPAVRPPWRNVRLERGDKFRIGTPIGVSCGYLAVEGGFDLRPVLGSLSTYCRSAIGGLDGRALITGDQLPLVLDATKRRDELQFGTSPSLAPPQQLRVVRGPQDDHFTERALAAFFSDEFHVSNRADRMGLRLDGPQLDHRDGYNIISDGIVTGAIQVPGSGQPIVLLADHQTTGGYPKIATVISADLPGAGRLMPGSPINFIEISVEAAEAAARRLEKSIERSAASLVPAGRPETLNETALYGDNLVSGVINAME